MISIRPLRYGRTSNTRCVYADSFIPPVTVIADVINVFCVGCVRFALVEMVFRLLCVFFFSSFSSLFYLCVPLLALSPLQSDPHGVCGDSNDTRLRICTHTFALSNAE